MKELAFIVAFLLMGAVLSLAVLRAPPILINKDQCPNDAVCWNLKQVLNQTANYDLRSVSDNSTAEPEIYYLVISG